MDLAIETRILTESGCRELLAEFRFPGGHFECPNCCCTRAYKLKTRDLIQCAECSKQVSLTSGTIFHKTRTPLIKLFKVVFNLASGSIMSASDQAKELDMIYSTLWRFRQKLRVLIEKNFPNKDICTIDIKSLAHVLFRRSVESPGRDDNEVENQKESKALDEGVFEPLSELAARSATALSKHISTVYHGVSEKYSQLYSTEYSFCLNGSKLKFDGLLSLLIRAGPTFADELSKYSSPKILRIPKLQAVPDAVP